MRETDLAVLRFFNGSDSLFLDGVIVALTSGPTWIPLYIALVYLVIKNNDNMRQIMLVLGCAALCVLVTSTVTDLIVKPWVARFRPTQDPLVKYTIDVVRGIRETKYGFFSAHASNTFGIALYISLVVRHRLFTVSMLLWSLLNCYTRLYLGVHYSGDILAGLAFGALAGTSSYMLYKRLYSRVSSAPSYVSTHYTTTGYSLIDIDIVMGLLALTLLYSVFYSIIVFNG